MGKFIKYLIVFSIGLIFLLGIISVGTNSIISKSDNFKLNKETKILILGHSHPEGALNDSLIEGARNFAQGGEVYFYAFLKLRKLLEKNNQINAVFIEFTNNQITLDMDDWDSDEKKIVDKFPKYAPVMNWKDYNHVLDRNPLAFVKAMQLVIKNNINFVAYRKKDFIKIRDWGGYYYNKRSHVDSIIKTQKKINDTNLATPKISTRNLNYLFEIIDLCKKKNVNLYLFRSPQHKEYLGIGNELQFQQILKTRFSNVYFLDFNDFPLNNEDYGDLEHLNYKGAKKFSLFFNSLLNDGLMQSNNPEQMVKQKSLNNNFKN